jgi:predicted nucleotidyltransferase
MPPMRKLKIDGKPIDIEPRMAALQAGLREIPGLAAAYLFGSYGTPYQTPLSDVDLALVFRRQAVPSFKQELDILGRILEALAEEDVSVTVLNRAPLLFQFRVLESGRPLYVADEVALADFLADVLSRHADFAIDHATFVREYDETLRELYHRA